MKSKQILLGKKKKEQPFTVKSPPRRREAKTVIPN
jgi:hypothetical protein